jgi:hypothetical protein
MELYGTHSNFVTRNRPVDRMRRIGEGNEVIPSSTIREGIDSMVHEKATYEAKWSDEPVHKTHPKAWRRRQKLRFWLGSATDNRRNKTTADHE